MESRKTNFFDVLPSELIEEMLSRVPSSHLLKTREVSTRFNAWVQNSIFRNASSFVKQRKLLDVFSRNADNVLISNNHILHILKSEHHSLMSRINGLQCILKRNNNSLAINQKLLTTILANFKNWESEKVIFAMKVAHNLAPASLNRYITFNLPLLIAKMADTETRENALNQIMLFLPYLNIDQIRLISPLIKLSMNDHMYIRTKAYNTFGKLAPFLSDGEIKDVIPGVVAKIRGDTHTAFYSVFDTGYHMLSTYAPYLTPMRKKVVIDFLLIKINDDEPRIVGFAAESLTCYLPHLSPQERDELIVKLLGFMEEGNKLTRYEILKLFNLILQKLNPDRIKIILLQLKKYTIDDFYLISRIAISMQLNFKFLLSSIELEELTLLIINDLNSDEFLRCADQTQLSSYVSCLTEDQIILFFDKIIETLNSQEDKYYKSKLLIALTPFLKDHQIAIFFPKIMELYIKNLGEHLTENFDTFLKMMNDELKHKYYPIVIDIILTSLNKNNINDQNVSHLLRKLLSMISYLGPNLVTLINYYIMRLENKEYWQRSFAIDSLLQLSKLEFNPDRNNIQNLIFNMIDDKSQEVRLTAFKAISSFANFLAKDQIDKLLASIKVHINLYKDFRQRGNYCSADYISLPINLLSQLLLLNKCDIAQLRALELDSCLLVELLYHFDNLLSNNERFDPSAVSVRPKRV